MYYGELLATVVKMNVTTYNHTMIEPVHTATLHVYCRPTAEHMNDLLDSEYRFFHLKDGGGAPCAITWIKFEDKTSSRVEYFKT
jgi:hypothetical protein